MLHTLLQQGGPVMWPLLACSVVSVAVIVERAIFWIRAMCRHDKELVRRVFDLTEAGEFEQAVDAGASSSSVAVRVLCAGLVHREYGLAQSMEAAASSEIESMKRGLSVLDTIITLAPLLGILGTVVGIIASFDLLGQAGIEDPKAVTGGIAQALITTAAGLSAAIVTLLPYNALARKLEKATKYLELIGTHFEVTYQKGVAKRHEAE
ncbi:MAG: MotA/TolQ/ExbB proton channel family protein [Verrucomicrobia bacterium]|nr:MotA/TolQ/ExbB proton channel family protein [Verrucomicrobiota bacterium]